MQLQIVFNQLLILFLFLVLGFVLRKLKFFDAESTSTLTKFVLYVSLPALVIVSMQLEFSKDMLLKGGIILGISVLYYIFCIIISFPIVAMLRTPKEDRGVLQFFIVFSNVAFMGFPVLTAVFGGDSLYYAAIYNLPFNLLVFTFGIWILKRDNTNTFNYKIFINPVIVSIIIGLILFALPFRFPPYIKDGFKMLGDITTPMSMIILGSALGAVSTARMFSGWRVYAIIAVRLLILPITLYFILRPFVTDIYVIGVPVIIAAMPVAANGTLMAIEYKANVELATKGVFLSTLFSVVTILLITMLFRGI